MLNDYMNQGTD